MDDGIELLREARMKVMAPALSVWPINDSDGPFEMRGLQLGYQIAMATNNQQESGNVNIVKHQLITIVHAGTDLFPLRNAAPIGCGGDGAGVGSEANENAFAPMPLTH